MKPKTAWSLARETMTAWSDDYASSMGAALAYYTMFSIAPLLLIVISVAGLFFGEQAARGEILDQLEGLMGADGAHAVQSLLASVNHPEAGLLATAFGIGALVVGATSVFGELQNAMDRIWRAPRKPEQAGVLAYLRARLLSLGMIFGIGFLLMVSLLVSALLATVQRWFGRYIDLGVFASLVDFALSFAFITVAFAMIYKSMPRVRVEWRDVWVGAIVTSLLFTVGKMGIGVYIGRSAVASTFGAAASLVAMVVWVYWSAQIFLLGAEFTRVYAIRCGSLRTQAGVPTGRAPERPSRLAQDAR